MVRARQIYMYIYTYIYICIYLCIYIFFLNPRLTPLYGRLPLNVRPQGGAVGMVRARQIYICIYIRIRMHISL